MSGQCCQRRQIEQLRAERDTAQAEVKALRERLRECREYLRSQRTEEVGLRAALDMVRMQRDTSDHNDRENRRELVNLRTERDALQARIDAGFEPPTVDEWSHIWDAVVKVATFKTVHEAIDRNDPSYAVTSLVDAGVRAALTTFCDGRQPTTPADDEGEPANQALFPPADDGSEAGEQR